MKRLFFVLAVTAVTACATVKPEHPVRVLSQSEAMPAGCQSLGPVKLTAGSVFDLNPVGDAGYSVLLSVTAAKGGDTLQLTQFLPLGGIAYRCNP